MINPAIVEHHDHDRQLVPANRLDLHSAEAEGAVAFDGDDRLAAHSRRGNGVSHADAHHAPRPDVKTLARLKHVDDVSSEVESIGAFIDDIYVTFISKHVTNRAERAREIHRVWIGAQLRRHALRVLLLLLIERPKPLRGWLDLARLECGEKGGHCRLDIADDGSGNRAVAVDLGRRDVNLNELRALAPQRRLSVREKPIQTGS